MLSILSLGMDGHLRDPQFSTPAQAFALPTMPSGLPDADKFIAALQGNRQQHFDSGI
ncbi:MAG: hypothetical protein KatS3mg053_2918 [Candidatus Roseilinea sp.]|nr:MAG: hypothetical protein KatS3mg053_2918 [Candidatus Roseilinea sp.]